VAHARRCDPDDNLIGPGIVEDKLILDEKGPTRRAEHGGTDLSSHEKSQSDERGQT
jgi:hypothetical protein